MKYVLRNKLYIFLIYIFDLAGNIVFFPFKFFSRKKLKDVNNILLIRLDHIGDVIFSTPIPHNLKGYYPNAKIVFLAGNQTKEILTNNPYIDEVMCYDAPWFNRNKKKTFEIKGFFALVKKIRSYNFDLGIDLRGDLRHILLMALSGIKFKVGFGVTGGGFLLQREALYRNNIHSIQHNLDLIKSIGINPVVSGPELYVNKESELKINKFLNENNIAAGDFIGVIHPLAGYSSKNWRMERFAELVNILYNSYRAKVILVGSLKDNSGIEKIISMSATPAVNAAGKITLTEFLALMKKAKIFIGVDSGPSHIAALSGTPVLILYSATNRIEEWLPAAGKTVIIQKDVSCNNCGRISCDNNVCMELISVQEVCDKLKKAVNS